MHQSQEVSAHDAPGAGAFFGHGSGKSRCTTSTEATREQILNGVGTLDPQDRMFGNAPGGTPSCRRAAPGRRVSRGQKISFWKSLGQRYEKGPVAASDIDLERRRTWEDLRQIERREIVPLESIRFRL